MKKIVISLIIFVVSSVGILSGCTGTPNNQNIQQVPETTGSTPKPYFVISDSTARRGFEGINYVFYIDFVIQNIGNASGQARVWSELNQNGNHYEKHQDIYLNTGGTQSSTFRYPEYSFWSTDPDSYLVWVENS